VIAITLNFKSIEAARQALLDIPASALVAGPAPEAEAPKPAAAPAAASGKATAKAGAAPGKTAAEKTPTAESVEAQPQASTAATEGNAAAASSAPEATAAPAASSIDYATLQKAVFALAGKSRESAAQVASSFGVKTFKELPQDKWGDALAAVQEKLAELENV
jgi:peptidoglycan DL-endopeptidase CwlO